MGRQPNAALDADSDLIADAAWHPGMGMAKTAKVLGPEQVVVAFAPEANVGGFADLSRDAFQGQYRHSNTPPPLLINTVVDHGAVARGAACSVLASLFSARQLQPDAESA